MPEQGSKAQFVLQESNESCLSISSVRSSLEDKPELGTKARNIPQSKSIEITQLDDQDSSCQTVWRKMIASELPKSLRADLTRERKVNKLGDMLKRHHTAPAGPDGGSKPNLLNYCFDDSGYHSKGW